MNAPLSRTQNKTRTVNQELSKFKGEREMNAPLTQSQGKLKVVYQEIKKANEEIEMRLAMQMTDVKTWLSKGLATKTPGKILGGLALGALLMTATALPLGPAFADGPSRPSTSEQIVVDFEEDYMHEGGSSPSGALTAFLPDPEEDSYRGFPGH